MMHVIEICRHCGIKHTFQASGHHYCLSHPKKYDSDKYCPDCEKARQEALEQAFGSIPIKFKDNYVLIKEAICIDASLKDVDSEYIFSLIKNEKQEEVDKERKELELFNQWVTEGSNLELYPYNGPKLPKSPFPKRMRVYSNLYNFKTNESSVTGYVDEIKNDLKRAFGYFYWPSKPSEMEIRVNVRLDLSCSPHKVVEYAR